jgi:hypothetical protein
MSFPASSALRAAVHAFSSLNCFTGVPSFPAYLRRAAEAHSRKGATSGRDDPFHSAALTYRSYCQCQVAIQQPYTRAETVAVVNEGEPATNAGPRRGAVFTHVISTRRSYLTIGELRVHCFMGSMGMRDRASESASLSKSCEPP